MGAMSFAESFKMLDLMLLISTLENRSMLERVSKQLESMDRRITKIEDASM